MSRTPTMAEVIRSAIESHAADLHVALPGKVTKYDAATQIADIKPMIKRVVRDEDDDPIEEEIPIITDVPVVFPGTGKFALTFPVSVGDTGMLIFCEADIDKWRETGNDVNPGDQRRHDLSGATFHPGLRTANDPDATADATNLQIGHNDYKVHLTDSEARFPHDATEFLARADKVLAELNAMAAAFNTHTHLVMLNAAAVAPPATTPVPTLVPTGSTMNPSSPKCDTVKAE